MKFLKRKEFEATTIRKVVNDEKTEVFYLATKSGGSFFGKVGSFEPGYDFDALVIDDAELNHDDYTLAQRLERFIYIGDDRQIAHRYVRGNEVLEPTW